MQNQISYRMPEEQAKHLEWWREARFGMFVTWGLYAQLERGEWVMNTTDTI